MSLKEKIADDFKSAFKEKKETEKVVLSMLKSEIKNREIELTLKDKELSDEEVISILMKMTKQRKDSVESYKKGGRTDLAQKEKAEIDVLCKYLPNQMSDEEIKKELEQLIEKQGITGKEEIGKLMGVAMGSLKGRADGGKIRKIAEGLLE